MVPLQVQVLEKLEDWLRVLELREQQEGEKPVQEQVQLRQTW